MLVLATSHMHNPGHDLLNVRWDDVLAEPRQRQLRELVDRLGRFRPTKVAIEANPGTTKAEDYERYLRGDYQLSRNEIDQVGFRLAKQSGHRKVHGIDADGDMPFDAVFQFAKAHGQQAILDRAIELVKREFDELNRRLPTATIVELHRMLNAPASIDEGHRSYLTLLRIGGGGEYPGVDLVTAWYKRNLTIFANLLRLTESPDDRILILIGAGHAKLLQQLIADSGDYELVSALDYL